MAMGFALLLLTICPLAVFLMTRGVEAIGGPRGGNNTVSGHHGPTYPKRIDAPAEAGPDDGDLLAPPPDPGRGIFPLWHHRFPRTYWRRVASRSRFGASVAAPTAAAGAARRGFDVASR